MLFNFFRDNKLGYIKVGKLCGIIIDILIYLIKFILRGESYEDPI